MSNRKNPRRNDERKPHTCNRPGCFVCHPEKVGEVKDRQERRADLDEREHAEELER